jgi:hypothetical protein
MSNVNQQFVISTNEPPNLRVGDEWYNPSTNILYKRVITDGITVQWVQINTGGGNSASTVNAITSIPSLNQVVAVGATSGVAIQITDTSDSNGVTQGALVVSGGGAFAKNVTIGGAVAVQNVTQSSNSGTGALVVQGGVGSGGNIYAAGRIGWSSTTTNLSAVYQYYNTVTNSLDTVFG